MMKILHTSDWHLGHTLFGFDRHEEQRIVLDKIAETVVKERPDAMLVCGDVFDSPQPSAKAQRLLADTIWEIHSAVPDTTIVITAGNHDSATRHEIFRTPWRECGVTVVGIPPRADSSPDDFIVEVPGRGWIIAVPYFSRGFEPVSFQRLSDRVGELNTASLPVVMMAHLSVAGADYRGHDDIDPLTIGGIECCRPSELGTGFDYCALGHIHLSQTIRGADTTMRYCGTPLPISFDEPTRHTVSLVEIDRHCATPRISEIEIPSPVPLVSIPAEGYTSWDEALDALRRFPSDTEAYIRLNVEQRSPLPPDAIAMARHLAAEKACRFCLCNYRRPESSGDAGNPDGQMGVHEFRDMPPEEIARRYATSTGRQFTPDMETMLAETMRRIETRKRTD